MRFTHEFQLRMTSEEVKRYTNREGVVHGYRLGANEPIVLFPKHGRRKEVKRFEVPPSRLEVVGA